MAARLGIGLVGIVVAVLAALWVLGRGGLSEPWHAGTPSSEPIPPEVWKGRESAQLEAARDAGVEDAKQILFGDLHVHTTFSADAFQMSLPMAGGDGAHPVADACDFARYCSALDFWSINDHALTSTPGRWAETVETIRQCNAVGDPAQPDVVAYLGWEWTQVGTRPENHYGHKNVILRDLERVPARPIAAGPPPGGVALTESLRPSTLAMGLFAVAEYSSGGPEGARYFHELMSVPICPTGVPVRELPAECQEQAATPKELFAKLDEWGLVSMVIPHGTTWGMYTPPGSAWDKQLTPEMHDPARQGLIEVFSGHGNSEEYREWREVVLHPDGTRSCPEPTPAFLPSCWRAGEIIAERCGAAGAPDAECSERAAEARQLFADADRNGGPVVVPGAAPAEWQDAGQCRDCFQPSFNYRPRSAVQYIMALGRPGAAGGADRFRFGFIASSDNHSARPGTGYKETARTAFTEARFGNFPRTLLGRAPKRAPEARAEPFDPRAERPIFAIWETERAASFFLNGGLAAVHAKGRQREAIWAGLERKEVYGTSGPRILLWFDLLNGPDGRLPMGGEAVLSEVPRFEVRAVGSFEQQPGCPDYSVRSLPPARLDRLCRGECHHPSDRRRLISRIEVVRIRPQIRSGEDATALIEDPWQVLPCPRDEAGCRVTFRDEDLAASGRGTLYYVRAIEAPGLAVAADPLGCERDAAGRCVALDPCFARKDSDDCLSETEERAWSSPIFVGFRDAL